MALFRDYLLIHQRVIIMISSPLILCYVPLKHPVCVEVCYEFSIPLSCHFPMVSHIPLLFSIPLFPRTITQDMACHILHWWMISLEEISIIFPRWHPHIPRYLLYILIISSLYIITWHRKFLITVTLHMNHGIFSHVPIVESVNPWIHISSHCLFIYIYIYVL